MAFRFDMRGASPQQQAIVAKRDAEEKLRRQEATNKEVISKSSAPTLTLAIDKDTCPVHDSIIINHQCSGCEYYKAYKVVDGQPCVECLYK